MRKLLSTSDHVYGWLVTSLSGVFMFLTLFVYRAYHIDEVPAYTGHGMLFRAIVQSAIIIIVFYTVEFHVAPRLRIDKKKKPLITAFIGTFIGLNFTFLAFNYFYHWTELHWDSYALFLYEYPLILVVPIALSYLIASLINIRKQSSNSLVTFTSENQKEHFQLKSNKLLYIKSADNYVEIYYQVAQQIDKRLIRRNLKSIEDEFALKETLIRCHRSYLVNPRNIDHVNQSSQKVELNIKGETIPVSKKYALYFTS